ncbi:MAG: 6-bladed beta-propeller [Tannerella sp.]|jgi:hypothetical protein|nr:6-bladed beta-propeller [Tannerella sp.]
MKRICVAAMIVLFASCGRKDDFGLQTIPVDVDQNISLLLSEIADDIRQVELELTDNSTIANVRKVLLCGEYILVYNGVRGGGEMLLFDGNGKFVRKIGRKGPGPGEYNHILTVTTDAKNGLIYVISAGNKLICYDLNGQLVREETSPLWQSVKSLNYINGKMLFIREHIGEKDAAGSFNRAMLYELDAQFQPTDSVEIRKVYLDRIGFWMHPYEDFLHSSGKKKYLYLSEQNPEPLVRDTLYEFKTENRLIPHLRLSFPDEGIASDGMKYIYLLNIYRSERYVFAIYMHDRRNEFYRFCYDLKTGKGVNMKDGYTDDANRSEERVSIRPFDSDVEKFYYILKREIPDNSDEEPNPTLYIGTLKK